MRVVIVILTYLLYSTIVNAQIEDSAYIVKHALPIRDRKNLDKVVYKALSPYQIILVGEIHGCAEPSEFVEGIVRVFLKKSKKVILGMEIPATQMQEFIDSGTVGSLRLTKFFTTAAKWGPDGDGRASEAWANLIISFRNKRIKYEFFDATGEQYKGGSQNRDSLMYENINTALLENPGAVFIGLCGGYHNLLSAQGGNQCPMAWYLGHAANSALTDTTKLLCLGQIFDTGTFNANNSGPAGLRVHEYTKSRSGVFGKAVPYSDYLLIGKVYEGYSGILYSRTIHASPIWLTRKE